MHWNYNLSIRFANRQLLDLPTRFGFHSPWYRPLDRYWSVQAWDHCFYGSYSQGQWIRHNCLPSPSISLILKCRNVFSRQNWQCWHNWTHKHCWEKYQATTLYLYHKYRIYRRTTKLAHRKVVSESMMQKTNENNEILFFVSAIVVSVA